MSFNYADLASMAQQFLPPPGGGPQSGLAAGVSASPWEDKPQMPWGSKAQPDDGSMPQDGGGKVPFGSAQKASPMMGAPLGATPSPSFSFTAPSVQQGMQQGMQQVLAQRRAILSALGTNPPPQRFNASGPMASALLRTFPQR